MQTGSDTHVVAAGTGKQVRRSTCNGDRRILRFLLAEDGRVGHSVEYAARRVGRTVLVTGVPSEATRVEAAKVAQGCQEHFLKWFEIRGNSQRERNIL